MVWTRLDTWWLNQRLGTRWLLASVALVLSMQLLVMAMVQGVIDRQVDARLQDELAAAERVFQSLLERETARLHDGAALLAASHGFREAFRRNDVPAMEEALDREGRRLGAQITALMGPDLRPRMTGPLDDLFLVWLQAVAYPDLQRPPPAGPPGAGEEARDATSGTLPARLQEIARVATQDRTQTTLALLGNAPFQFAVAPVVDEASNRVRAWVLMAFPLQEDLARKLQDTLDVQVALLSRPQDAPVQRVFDTMGVPLDGPSLTDGQTEATVGGERLVLRRQVRPAVGGEVHIVLMRSHSAVMAPFHQLQGWLALISLGGLALFVWASARSVRRITAPLQRLQAATEALREGRFDTPLLMTPGQDEVAQLSVGFDAMRRSLSAQQVEMRRLASLDRLTGLPNRQRFVDAVATALERASDDDPVAVLSVNLDRFKHVNEVLGYAFGDELLRAVGERLRELGGAGDRLSRLGGDEFGLLLKGTSRAQAEATAQQLLGRLAEGVKLNGQRVDIRASIGVAFGPMDATTADALVNRAEMAMRWAKRRLAGVQCFTAAHDTSRADTLSLLSDMRQGLDRGEMKVYLQPKIPLRPGDRVLAAEALVRWRHPAQGLIPPGHFIPFAEQTGFIGELTHWMLNAVAEACAEWRRAGQPCQVSVNVSTRDLLDERFPQQVQAVLNRHDLPASDLELEITESAIMDDPERAEATLQGLAALGVGLAIDDFGTGYSSLAYLKRLPVQALKIDQSFVRDMERQDNDAIIVRSTIELAHSLGLEVVAEGVESGVILDRLRQWGCDWAQGYHIAMPMPLQDFRAWASAHAEDGR